MDGRQALLNSTNKLHEATILTKEYLGLLRSHPERAEEIADMLVSLHSVGMLNDENKILLTHRHGKEICEAIVKLVKADFYNANTRGIVVANAGLDDQVTDFIIDLHQIGVSDEEIFKINFMYGHHVGSLYRAKHLLEKKDIQTLENLEEKDVQALENLEEKKIKNAENMLVLLKVPALCAEVVSQAQIELYEQEILNDMSRKAILANPRISLDYTINILIFFHQKKILCPELYEAVESAAGNHLAKCYTMICNLLENKLFKFEFFKEIDNHVKCFLCKIVLANPFAATGLIDLLLNPDLNPSLFNNKIIYAIGDYILTKNYSDNLNIFFEELKIKLLSKNNSLTNLLEEINEIMEIKSDIVVNNIKPIANESLVGYKHLGTFKSDQSKPDKQHKSKQNQPKQSEQEKEAKKCHCLVM